MPCATYRSMARPLLATRVQARTRTGTMAELIARQIAELSNDGEELVRFVWRVFMDPTMPFDDRRWALEWLADRGAGKAMAKVEVSGHVGVGEQRMNLEDLTFEEMDAWAQIQNKVNERKRLAQTTDAQVIDVPTSDPT